MTQELDPKELRKIAENAGEAWSDGEHIDIITPSTVLALLTQLEQAQAQVARVEKLLKDSEEVESAFTSQYDKIWIDCVRRALDGEPNE